MAATLALAGCTVGPAYHRPLVSTPAAYAETAGPAAGAVLDPDADLASWWTRLNDPILNDLVARALAGNPGLAAAVSRVREARASERVASAAQMPSISASGDALTFNSNRAPTAGLPIPSHIDFYSAGFDASWELDLFGGARRSIEAAKANTAAADWGRRDGQVSLIAEVASDYLSLRILQARVALGQAELQRQNDLFGLIHARRVSGFVTDLDVNQQSVAIATAAALIPQLRAEAQVQIHALGVLVGEPPESLMLQLQPVDPGLPPAPVGLPQTLPSDLLQRRPDLREAERRLAAANAMIGVNDAALYPKLNLLGLASFGSTTLDQLFSRGNLVSAGVAMVTQPIFNGGRTRAAIAVAKEERAQALYAYQAAVFGGFRDVEDALARYRSEDARRLRFGESVVAAGNTLAIAQDQYRTGFVTYINVLQAQDALLNNRDQLVQSEGQVLTDLVSLYKALGGGWDG